MSYAHATPPQNENLDSKIHHLQASELKFYDVRRAQFFNISNICWGLFEKRPPRPFLTHVGSILHLWAVFGLFFWGCFQIFWSLNIIGGDHRPILFFVVFHFWAILGLFVNFGLFFILGHFCIFGWSGGPQGGSEGLGGVTEWV